MKINILDAISKYVNLKKVGPGYAAICPFCGAKGVTDFTISVRYQKYKCSICGASGGIFQFLIDFRGISLEQAIEEIKGIYNISFDAHYLDSRWNNYFRGTDFKDVLKTESIKAAVLIKPEAPEAEGLATTEAVTYTELATFIRCPLEYKLRYRDKTKEYEPAGIRIYTGRFLHSIATQYLKQPLEKRNQKFIESQFQEELSKKRGAEYKDEIERFKEPTTVLLLNHLFDKILSNKSPHFKTRFGHYVITGTADCLIELNNGIQIIEFKEYDYREFDEEINILHYLQLLFYFFGLEGVDNNILTGTYCFFINGNIDEITFTDDIISRGEKFIKERLDEMLQCKEFIPTLNTLCVSCGYRNKCESYRESKGRT